MPSKQFINVTDAPFSARGDGTVDDSDAIQAAIDAVQNQMRHSPTMFDANFAQGPKIYFPAGVYKLSKELSVPDYMDLWSDEGATLWQSDDTLGILRIGAFYNTIRGLMFVGGRNAIILNGRSQHYGGNMGTNTAGGENFFSNLKFRYQIGPSIYQDPSVEYRGSSAGITLLGFDLVGSCLYYGTMDQFTAAHGYITVNDRPPPDGPDRSARFDNGNLMPLFASHGILNLWDIALAPQTLSDETAHGRPRKAVIEGNGIFRTNAFRFGGELILLPWRIRGRNMSYNGLELPRDANALAHIISFADALSSTGNINVIEIYDDFPALIHLHAVIPNGPIGGARSYVPFNGARGIWVDSASCPKSKFLSAANSSKNSMLLYYDGEENGQLRVRTSTEPESLTGEDITAQLAQYWAEERHRSAPGDCGRRNLWISGGAVELDPTGSSGGSMPNLSASADTSTGYPLRTLTSTLPTDDGYLYFFAWDGANPDGWGKDLPAGRYTVSFLVRANFSGQILLALDYGGTSVLKAKFHHSTAFQRVGMTFYHDGAPKKLGFSVYGIPGTAQPGGPGQITLGLPLIQSGDTIGEWSLPSQKASIVEDKIIGRVYRGPAPAPASGAFVPGDVYEVYPPMAGQPWRYVCTATSPLAWKIASTLSA
jgi:hypothetical protein